MQPGVMVVEFAHFIVKYEAYFNGDRKKIPPGNNYFS